MAYSNRNEPSGIAFFIAGLIGTVGGIILINIIYRKLGDAEKQKTGNALDREIANELKSAIQELTQEIKRLKLNKDSENK